MHAAWEETLARNLYYDTQFEKNAVKVLPGEYYAARTDMMMVTVLGSCVAACIRDRVSGIGGMNHFMLPDAGEHGRQTAGTAARYGIYAMEILINQLLKLGARKESLEAKVFGGGNVLASIVNNQVGKRNAEFVLAFLETERIPVMARDLLDDYPRKVFYFPATGKALVKELRAGPATLVQAEREYRHRLVEEPVAGEILLYG